MTDLISTEEFAKQIHASQVGEDGQPHWRHTARVAEGATRILSHLPDGTLSAEEVESIIKAAHLHDGPEDHAFTGITIQTLAAMGYDGTVLAIVGNLTRPEGEGRPTYMAWIRSLADGPREPLAVWLGTVVTKLADNRDNLSPERVATLPPEKRSITGRWERSARTLERALVDAGFGDLVRA